MIPEQVRDTYLRYVVVPKNPDACWEWAASITKSGYPNILHSMGSENGKQIQKHYYGHRVSYELHNGIEPGNLFVCHSCDNPTCTNPRHLWLGTCADNARDAQLKGRLGKKKYTAEFIAEYQDRVRANITEWQQIASDMGIKSIERAYRLAKQIAPELMPEHDRPKWGQTGETLEMYAELYSTGLIKAPTIANAVGCHPNTVRTYFKAA